jgi:hypothetical protein
MHKRLPSTKSDCRSTAAGTNKANKLQPKRGSRPNGAGNGHAAPNDPKAVAVENASRVCFTVFESTSGPLSKTYRLLDDGGVRDTGHTNMVSGKFVVRAFDATRPAKALVEIGRVFEGLSRFEAISLSTPRDGSTTGRIVTKARRAQLQRPAKKSLVTGVPAERHADADALSRALECFGWPAALCLQFIDGDDKYDRLDEILVELCPLFADVAMLVRPGASASVIDPRTGKPLKKSEHLYHLLDDPSKAKACLHAILRLSWCRGKGRSAGWIKIGSDGRLYERGPADVSVGSPERLAYEGAATVDERLATLPRPAKLCGGAGVLRAADLLAYAEQHAPLDDFQQRVAEAKNDPAIIAGQKAARARHREQSVEASMALGVSREDAEREYDRVRARNRTRSGAGGSGVGLNEREMIELSLYDVIYLAPDDKPILVRDMVENPKAFHEKMCADPAEGLNYPSKNCGWITTNGCQILITSRAHGDTRAFNYSLIDWEDFATRLRKVVAINNMPLPIAAPNWRERFASFLPKPSLENARLAIKTLGVVCLYNEFNSRAVFVYQNDAISSLLGDDISDLSVMALRQLLSETFGFDCGEHHVRDAAMTLALSRRFNPVVDLLAEAEANWDGVARLDRVAADYFNAEDTPLNAAFMRKMMIAAVARVRTPGCKFDTITVLESPEGWNKSSAWRVLAMRDEWFSDAKIIGKEAREVQEQLSNIWIHESADLAGMKKADIEIVKDFASRQSDDARPAYGRLPKQQPRHSVEVGTTNADTYLLSQTGNRRFWPIKVLAEIDLDKLMRDRMQLWAEAAHQQSQGESLTLDRSLWAAAAVEQEARRVRDAWEDKLARLPVKTNKAPLGVVHQIEGQQRVAAADLLDRVLNLSAVQQTTATAMRLSTVMRVLGWKRAKNGYVVIDGRRVTGYFRDVDA